MIGTIQSAVVVRKFFTRPDADGRRRVKSALLRLPDGSSAVLKVVNMPGGPYCHRQSKLAALKVGAVVEVKVCYEHRHFPQGRCFWVSCRPVERMARRKAAEALLRNSSFIRGIVKRVEGRRALVRLPDDLEGRLHVSCIVGRDAEERAERLAGLAPGTVIRVKVREVLDLNGTLAVGLVEVDLRPT